MGLGPALPLTTVWPVSSRVKWVCRSCRKAEVHALRLPELQELINLESSIIHRLHRQWVYLRDRLCLRLIWGLPQWADLLRNRGTAERNVPTCACACLCTCLCGWVCVYCVCVSMCLVRMIVSICMHVVYVCKEKCGDDSIVPTTLFHPNQVSRMCH